MRTLALGLQPFLLAQGGTNQDSSAGSCGVSPFFVVLTGLKESFMPLLSHCLSSHLLQQLDFCLSCLDTQKLWCLCLRASLMAPLGRPLCGLPDGTLLGCLLLYLTDLCPCTSHSLWSRCTRRACLMTHDTIR